MRWPRSIRRNCWRACRVKSEPLVVAAVLTDATHSIASALGLDSRSARLEARVLAAHVLNVAPSWLIAHDTDALDAASLLGFRALLDRRLAGEPIAYLTGRREFYGYIFRVTPDVLIPRPETELLVERALAHIPPNTDFDILDLGCGSGCVALSLALQRPLARITALDHNAAALEVARDNAEHLNANVEFLSSDWYSALGDRQFDMIVSNPPYVANDDVHLSEGDVRFEPTSALVSGKDGLDALRHVIQGAHSYLRAPGYLLLEHGHDQAEQVARLFTIAGMASIQIWTDLAGIPRISACKLSE